MKQPEDGILRPRINMAFSFSCLGFLYEYDEPNRTIINILTHSAIAAQLCPSATYGPLKHWTVGISWQECPRLSAGLAQ